MHVLDAMNVSIILNEKTCDTRSQAEDQTMFLTVTIRQGLGVSSV
jgi:hypothetical protein